MALEITVNQQIRVLNGAFKFPGVQGYYGPSSQQSNQAAPGIYMPIVSAITTGQGTLVDLTGLVAINGWILFTNLDPTNYVEWGPDDGSGNLVKCGQMLPGESAGPFRGDNLKYRFKANTLACEVQPLFVIP